MKSRAISLTLTASLSLLAAYGGGGHEAPIAAAPAPAPSPAPVPSPAPAPASSGFPIALSADNAVVFHGGTGSVHASATRPGSFAGAGSMALSGLPAGVSASPVIVSSINSVSGMAGKMPSPRKPAGDDRSVMAVSCRLLVLDRTRFRFRA